MFRKIRKFFVPAMSLLLAFVMVFVTACSNNLNDEGNDNSPDKEITTPSDNDKTQGDDSSSDDSKDQSDDVDDSDNPIDPPNQDFVDLLDYEVDDSANFIYNLVNNDLQQEYSTFVGYVSPAGSSDSNVSKGIAYTDYQQGYIDDAGKTYFSAGFIVLPTDEQTSKNENAVGAEIHSLEETEENQFSYIYAYNTEDLHKHAVAYGKLIEYDIIDGELQYREREYTYGMAIDVTRGDLWSYDTNRYLYRTEPQGYVPTAGVGLLGEAEYQEIVDAVNGILQSQEANFKYADLQTYSVYAAEALNSYILGLQEETFMGIPTESLKEFAKSLDPLEHLQIQMDEEGNIRIEIIKVEKLATTWEKILTSIVCAYSVVAGVCCNILGDIIPGTKILFGAAGGALIGAAMEAFSQVVISGTSVDTMAWDHVIVAAVSGCIAGALSVKIGSMNSVLVRNTVDTLVDGVIGGSEFFVNALIDGESLSQALTKFGYGLATGIVVSAVFKGVSFVAKKGTSWIKKTVADVPDVVNERPIRELTEDATGDAASRKVAMDGAQSSVNKVDQNFQDNYTKISDKQKNHVLNGDARGGGHAYRNYQEMLDSGKMQNLMDSSALIKHESYADGVFEIEFKTSSGRTKKTFFPESWSDDKIMTAIKNIGTSDTFMYQSNKRVAFFGIFDGVPMWVIKAPGQLADGLAGDMITAFPMDGITAKLYFPNLVR